jgi:hypothetical protein
VALFVLFLLLLQSLIDAPPALALGGVYHNPYGTDDLYSTEPTERFPRDPMAGENVYIKATTWPIEWGQSVWVTWTKNGVGQPAVGASWQYNSGNNSYWEANLGSFARGDAIEYYVHANVNGTNEQVIGPFSFKVTSWSNVTNVIGHTNNSTSVDLQVGDSAGSFSPRIRFSFSTLDSFRLQLAPSGSGLTASGLSSYSVTDSSSTLTIATSALVLKIQKNPYRLSVYKGDGTTLIARIRPDDIPQSGLGQRRQQHDHPHRRSLPDSGRRALQRLRRALRLSRPARSRRSQLRLQPVPEPGIDPPDLPVGAILHQLSRLWDLHPQHPLLDLQYRHVSQRYGRLHRQHRRRTQLDPRLLLLLWHAQDHPRPLYQHQRPAAASAQVGLRAVDVGQ